MKTKVNYLQSIPQILKACDGWTIHPDSVCEELGVPKKLIKKLSRRHESVGTGSGAIDVGGVPVPYFDGVWCLELLYEIADDVEADLSGVIAVGRGTKARQLIEAIEKKLNLIATEV